MRDHGRERNRLCSQLSGLMRQAGSQVQKLMRQPFSPLKVFGIRIISCVALSGPQQPLAVAPVRGTGPETMVEGVYIL